LGNVNKVFSHSIRAFLAWLDLEYSTNDPNTILNVQEFTRVKTTVNDLLRYIPTSEEVVDAYTRILQVPNSIVIDLPCNDLENVKKVFSHSSKAFLGWAKHDVEYNPDEPVNQ
jgi:hypothetical protein